MGYQPKILTIIVTYNGEKYIQHCLECLRNSVGAEHNNVLVIDNDSSDSTCAIIERNFPEVELIHSDENLGFGKANNIGLREALKRDIDHVFLLNQDAYVDSNTISCLQSVAQVHPEVGILSPLQLNGDGSAIDYTFYPYCLCASKELVFDLAVRNDLLKSIYPVYFTNAAAWFIPLDFLKKVGGFAPIYPHYGEDNDLINRCHFHGFKVGICPEVSIRHDRPQQERTLKEKTVARLTQDAFIRSLIIFTNIGDQFPNTLKLALVRSIRNQLVEFRFKKLVAEFLGWCRILKVSKTIMKTRRECSRAGASYISEHP